MESPSIEIFEVRASIYGLLATLLYSEPSSETLEKTREQLGFVKGMFRLWSEPAFAANVQNLLNAMEQSIPENLAVDYAGLFLGGKEGLTCPSESSYLEKILYGQTTLRVIEFYAQHGFAKDDSFHEPDDHIAVECAFMSVLGRNFIEMARREGMDSAQCHKQLELQLHFLTEHLMKWIPDWANQVRDFSETDFYRTLAGLTQTWIEADQRFLINSLRTHQNPVGR